MVRLVARGRTNAEISAELFLSLGTIKSHLVKVQSKLAITNSVQIAALGLGTRPGRLAE